MTPTRAVTGVVLAGAAALGAYEVGVLSHIIDDVARDVGPGAFPTVLAGTSAGAINAAALAAFADDPAAGMEALRQAWSELRIGQMVRPSSIEILSLLLDITGAPIALRRAMRVFSVRGGLLAPDPIQKLVSRAPLHRIADHLRNGRLHGIAISATRVSNGDAVVFHQTQGTPHFHDEHVKPIATELTVPHVLASAAIPLLFPPIDIAGELYCDGGLRQMVPLSPALRLGAERLLVVNPLPAMRPTSPRPAAVTSPLYIGGKALNALFADRVEADYGRLMHVSAIVRAGKRRFGPDFESAINEELAHDGLAGLREIDAVRIEPTLDLGVMAASYVASDEFARNTPGTAGTLLRILADGDPERAGDLLAYLMFDGGFTSALIDVGRADARARHADLCALFAAKALDRR